MRIIVATLAGSLAISLGSYTLWADERLKEIACRSVHLAYEAPEGVAFYCEAIVVKSAPGTYFATCGWDQGYCGMQELARGNELSSFRFGIRGKTIPARLRQIGA
jgi:hypothetical protein